MTFPPMASLLVTTLIFSGIQAFGHDPADAIQNGQSDNDYFLDPMASEYDPSNELPRIQDYPSPLDQIQFDSTGTHNDSLASPLDLHRFFNTPVNQKTRAASTNSQEFLDHVNIIARIANGISLQSGLMNDEIDIEDVAGELLNFGDVPVSTIAKFNPEAVMKFATKLKEISNALDSSILAEEQQVLILVGILKSSRTIGDVKNLPGKTEYFSYLKELKTFDYSSLTYIRSTLETALQKIGRIGSPEKYIQKYRTSFIVSDFYILSLYLNDIIKEIETFKKSLQTLRNSELKHGSTIFGPLRKIIDLAYLRGERTGLYAKAVAKSNMQEIAKLSADESFDTQDIATVIDLAVSRSNPSQSRKVTSGFPNGVSDVNKLPRDVRDPWIEKIIGIDKPLFSLINGLHPLSQINDELSDLDEKLAVLSTSIISETLANIGKFQKELSNSKKNDPTVVNVTETVWEGLDDCWKRGTRKNDFKEIEDVIENVRILTEISQFELPELDLDALNATIENFLVALSFSDLSNEAQSITELPKVMEKLEKSGSLQEINRTITDLFVIFDGSRVSQLKEKAEAVVSKKDNLYNSDFDWHLEFYVCMEKVKGAEKVAQAITVTQKLRALKEDGFKALDSAISAISSVSEDLSNLGSLTADMKKNPDVTTKNLNKFPNSAAQSEVVAQSAASLRFAHGLKEMDSEIAHLKNLDYTVKMGIAKVYDQADRDELTTQWGDHKSDMNSLDQTLSAILSFESNLDAQKAKTLEEFSNPLKNLGTIPDVKINLPEKSKALGFLISQPQIDSTVKTELERAKQTLDKLAELDLGFAAHQSEFQKAPSAFKALQDFLVGFFNVKQKSFHRHRKIPFGIGRHGQRGM
ncbi:hypothetical protein B9Z55_015951 [Caenorhabditis nigoni]|uniref:Domain of unknown function WSN domain-containing protein n=1 Tax=Caenorhabditis nigoni TaxID=1611254 RepID=A0A2G5UDE0_9PELO|nr:hypothetical protein B9Z55_015951 [Caenorhabditis nigoni]